MEIICIVHSSLTLRIYGSGYLDKKHTEQFSKLSNK